MVQTPFWLRAGRPQNALRAKTRCQKSPGGPLYSRKSMQRLKNAAWCHAAINFRSSLSRGGDRRGLLKQTKEIKMSNLTGKVAVVTGASKGIGAGIAKAFGEAGASVVVNYASSKEGADKVVADITAKGGKAAAIQADVSKSADVVRLFAETEKAFGALDVLVNNAGVFLFAPLENVTEDEFHRQFNTNVLGMILSIREAAKYFGSEGGSVINITSIASLGRIPTSVVYSATKGAVDAITRVLAMELAPRKIRVNAVAPGMTASEGFDAMGILGTEAGDAMLAGIPMGRIGQPEDIARTVLFLASDESSWVTGDRISASGGQY